MGKKNKGDKKSKTHVKNGSVLFAGGRITENGKDTGRKIIVTDTGRKR